MYRGKSTAAPDWYPAAANGVSATTHAGTLWTFGAYIEVVAAGAVVVDALLTAMSFLPPASAHEGELHIGIGGAGAEVVVGVVRFRVSSGTTQAAELLHVLPFPVKIPAGVRVAVRHRGNNTAQAATGVAVQLQRIADLEAF
jgi:hypothetical protein